MINLNLGNHKYKRKRKRNRTPLLGMRAQAILKSFPRARRKLVATTHGGSTDKEEIERNHGGNGREKGEDEWRMRASYAMEVSRLLLNSFST